MKQDQRGRFFSGMSSLIIFLLLANCGAREANGLSTTGSLNSGPVAETGYYIYTVQSRDDTLHRIAEWYTGNVNHWKALALANPHLKHGRLSVGDEVWIPKDILIRTAALPQKRVHVSYYKHEVAFAGETLCLMAKWYTGDIGNWKELVAANPQIKNPHVIHRGDVVYIPEDLMITHEPMPKKFVDKSRNAFPQTLPRPIPPK